MDADERERMKEICLRLQEEQDTRTFSELLQQLNALLERKERRPETWDKNKNGELSMERPV